MRILRCERCAKPCMLTTLDNDDIRFCPVNREPVEWKQVNKTERVAMHALTGSTAGCPYGNY